VAAMQRCSDSAQEAAAGGGGGLALGGSKLQPFKLLALPNVREGGTAARDSRRANTALILFFLLSPRRRLSTSSCSAVHCQELTPLAA
jgi:hypothetical protein